MFSEMADRTCWWNATVHHVQPDSDAKQTLLMDELQQVSLIFSVCFFANASMFDDFRRTLLHYFSQTQHVLIGTFALFIYHGFQRIISQVKQLVSDPPSKDKIKKKPPEYDDKKKKKKKWKKAHKGDDSQAVSILYLGQPVGRNPLKVKALPPISADSCTYSERTYYAVRVGFQTGVFSTWHECKCAVKNYPGGAVFHSFKTKKEAKAWLYKIKPPMMDAEPRWTS